MYSRKKQLPHHPPCPSINNKNWLTSGDFNRNLSLILHTDCSICGSGSDIQELQSFRTNSLGSAWQFSKRRWSCVTEWVASEAGVSLWWSLLASSSRPSKGVPNWTWRGGVCWERSAPPPPPPPTAAPWWLVWTGRATGVPISSLALGWRKTLSSKSPSASTFISYSRFSDLLQN